MSTSGKRKSNQYSKYITAATMISIVKEPVCHRQIKVLDDEVETKTADLANLGLVQNIHLAELWLARATSGDSQLGLEQR